MKQHPFGKKLFSFAVISDTHLNEDETTTNSPFDVNRLANRRFRYVVSDINTRDVAHVIHLGDVVHPVPSHTDAYRRAAREFFDIAENLRYPLHLIPGNHDVGDKPISWGPAGNTRQSFVNAWSECFGDHFFWFERDGIAFAGLNVQIMGSGLPLEAVQHEWFFKQISETRSQRILIFSHYPPFLLDEDEEENYDNLAGPVRQEMLDVMDNYPVEALFAGHVHHFWFHRYGNCNCYLLPSTAFTRQDYSEMFRISPQQDFGRNDSAKLGYLIIHMHENGHEFELIRCNGIEAAEGSDSITQEIRLNAVSPLSNRFPLLGFDLRSDWCELTQIPPSGALDEFDRKTVRNDYPLLALWEMGVKRLRIPLTDILDERRRSRIRDLKQLGFEFTLYSSVPETQKQINAVQAYGDLVDCWEISGKLGDLDFIEVVTSSYDHAVPIRRFFSPILSKKDIIKSGQKYYHVINHGFRNEDSVAHIEAVLNSLRGKFDGVVFRCGFGESIEHTIQSAKAVERELGIFTSIHLRFSHDNPAQIQASQTDLCHRLAAAMYYAWYYEHDRIFCDTLADADRGYFPRCGLLDRNFNPTSGALVVKQLHALFSHLGSTNKPPSSNLPKCSIATENGYFTMRLPGAETTGFPLKSNRWYLDWIHARLVQNEPDEAHFPRVYVALR